MVASAAKSEVWGLFHNGQTAIPLSITLHELGFLVPSNPTKTDNSTAEVILPLRLYKKVQGNEYAILFNEEQVKIKRLLHLLKNRNSIHGVLLHKTSLTTSP